MVKRSKLILLTTSFPYKGSFESNFIQPELPFLLKQFEQIVILPSKASKEQYPLDPRVSVSSNIAKALGFPSKIKLLYHLLNGLCFTPPSTLTSSTRIPLLSVRRAINYANLGMAWSIFKQLRIGIQNGDFSVHETLFYSYWCKYTALALVWLKAEFPELKVITRAHNSDLYREDAPYKLVTGQDDIIKKIDSIFCISQNGVDYLKKRFPKGADRIKLARLGTIAPSETTQPPIENTILVASCSSLRPLKRMSLMLNSLSTLASLTPKTIHWHHFGDGPELENLLAESTRNSAANLHIHFHGNKPLKAIMHFYQTNPVSVFLNTSRTEGIPVSMMEAMSCGIPCVAPAVGGIPEILVTGSGGTLVPTTASSTEFAKAILEIASNPIHWLQQSDSAKNRWQHHYDAEKNFHQFSEDLAKLC